MGYITPFVTEIDFASGTLSAPGYVIQRKLSDMASMYVDGDEAARILADEGDRLIYEVQGVELPAEEGQIPHCTTRITAGRIGAEYHMTKGHYHARREQGEVYFGLSGHGILVMQTETGETSAQEMVAGSAAYVPPFWAHRTVNAGDEDFVFFSVWEARAGHDYGTIERDGFRKLVVLRDGAPAVVDNPKVG
ncbi:MAG: cupin domain-containing protein [Chloroflexota bacterium]|nr:cupin domain-containing protein [Chloroflexota bacterium]MDE2911289.1 cupin domain-containing protein [Chloroflexota bacterium]